MWRVWKINVSLLCLCCVPGATDEMLRDVQIGLLRFALGKFVPKAHASYMLRPQCLNENKIL